MGDLDEQLAIITGKSDQIRQAQLRIEELVETALKTGKEGGGGGYHNKSYAEKERMSVPAGRVGMVIGKGGEIFKDAETQTHREGKGKKPKKHEDLKPYNKEEFHVSRSTL